MKTIKRAVKRLIPEKAKSLLRYLYFSSRYFGFRYECSCCSGHFNKILTFGVKFRKNAKCPRCGSLERHRLLQLYLKNKTDFFNKSLRVLHISPLEIFRNDWSNLPNLEYISIDLLSTITTLQVDISNIPLPDNQFDWIICYHVLEHISDDAAAMKELFRVLKPGGTAILQVPINSLLEKTYEDPSITSPQDRERAYGQTDHLRTYGLDYKDRLEKSGFIVKPLDYTKELGDDLITKYCLMKSEVMYLCTKQ